MIKNVLPSLRQRAGPQRICSRQKSIRSGTARDSFSQTPHMRGKVLDGVKVILVLGITPAHAGKRSRCTFVQTSRWDHPRTCGEKSSREIFQTSRRGSPPRMRGKVALLDFVHVHAGITPAHAGKRLVRYCGRYCDRDHPRTCGEKDITALNANNWQGSPPRMQGKEKRSVYCSCSFQDHPRVCGEKHTHCWPLWSV